MGSVEDGAECTLLAEDIYVFDLKYGKLRVNGLSMSAI